VVGIVVIIKILTLTASLNVIYSVVTKEVNTQSFLGVLLQSKYQSQQEEYSGGAYYMFITISRICKSFFLFGYTLHPNTEWCDRLTAILTHSVAFAFHFWGSAVLYNCVMRVDSLEHRMSVHRSQSLAVLRRRRLPDTIHNKVVKYFDHQMSSLVIIEKNNCLFKSFPRVLVAEIKLCCYRKYVARIPCFSNWPPEVIANIVELLEPEIYLPDDLVRSVSICFSLAFPIMNRKCH
jgi:hypothetical protein